MITISLCMIVKNEEKTLDTCLASVKEVVDELIIVDTGSTDQTLCLAKGYTDHVHTFRWINDFSAARNFAFQKATMDFILTMDADDFFSSEDQDKLKQLKMTLPPSIDAVTMKCLAAFDESGHVLIDLRQVRLVKRNKQFKWHGAVHEYLEVDGNVFHSDISVTHKRSHQNMDRNLLIYEDRLKQGISFTPRDLLYYANELFDHGDYQKAITTYLDFLKTDNPWLEDVRTAYGRIADCYAQLTDIDLAIHYSIKSIQLGSPRPEDGCRLGFFFLQKGAPEAAISCFKLATLVPEVDYGGVIHHACSTWIPHLQLCICYSRQGEINKAYEHIMIAHSFCPNHALIAKNKSILEAYLKKNSSN